MGDSGFHVFAALGVFELHRYAEKAICRSGMIPARVLGPSLGLVLVQRASAPAEYDIGFYATAAVELNSCAL